MSTVVEPTLGRIVHYKLNEREHAAIITKVWGGDCIDIVFFYNGLDGPIAPLGERKTSVLKGDQEGQWHWPERV